MTPPDQVPTLSGTLEIGIAFDDPDASWYTVWAEQAGIGGTFTVTTEGGTTTVKMAEGTLTLAPVPLTACETRKATAHIYGSDSVRLIMHADLDDGTVFATTDGRCSNLPLM